ncbi:hypothetical protein [Peribacillus sp. V2I11]|uniref:hypothetical protein n=1 Tax=Peribacillus sp. V2I11 TaxID=3042277 RepID=UPI002786D726|nr:hypothetical protein [Peribacillus sp. V2I11]
MLENSLRAETGDVLHRPLGSSKKWLHLDPITFIPAQTTPLPIDGEEDVDVKVIIGFENQKNQIPLMIKGMAYGIETRRTSWDGWKNFTQKFNRSG